MSTKQLLPNQHQPLHYIYGQNDCCLCRAEQRIKELEAALQKEIEQRVVKKDSLTRKRGGKRSVVS